jgi:uncharacterized protein (UPF0333 family)
MMKMDVRGQISVELVLIVGIIAVIVLVVASFLGDQLEQNNIASATRLGAVNATTQLGLLNRTIQPVRVNGISMTGSDNITVQISFSSPVTSFQSQIFNSINQSLTSQGYSTWYNSTSQSNIPLKTSRHFYNITLV